MYFGDDPVKSRSVFLASSVHVLTSLGILCSLFAALNVFDKNLGFAFVWLGIALFIDAIDGTLARKVQVSKLLPNINGLMMDSIIDFINYIFIPCLILVHADFLLPDLEIALPATILIISIFSYSRMSVTSEDFKYVGFPVAWNIIVLYLFILETSQMINTIVIFIFIGLRFIPLKYVHPFRTKHMRKQTLLITSFWFTSMAVLCLNKAVTINPILIQPAHAILAITTLYFIGITLLSGRTLISGKAS